MTIQSVEYIGNLLSRKKDATEEEKLELMKLLGEVEQAGIEVIKTKSNQELTVVLSMIQTMIQMQLISEGNLEGMFSIMQNKDLFEDVAIVPLKIVLGIASLWEWR